MKLYQKLAEHVTGVKCKPPYNKKHLDAIDRIMHKHMPHGSGIDAGVTVNHEGCRWNKIVLDSSFHVMDENGYYDGWINFQVIIRPCFTGMDLEIKPLSRVTYFKTNLHDYIFDVFYYVLDMEVE